MERGKIFIALSAVLLVNLAALNAGSAQSTQILAEAEWLQQNLSRGDLRIIDVGTKEEYMRGHIPGAASLPLEAITETIAGVPGMLASSEKLERLFSNLGIDDDKEVVIYDTQGGPPAARLFWALEYTGHKKVRLLNGGFQYWISKGFAVSQEVPKLSKASYKARVSKELVATKEWLLSRLGEAGLAIVDARSLKEYKGEDVRAARGGHIPGAVNVEWVNTLMPGSNLFKPAQELEQLYKSAGVTPDKEVVTYCQTGVRAAHAYFTLRLLGYPRVRVYDGSWVEWGNDRALPMASGGC